MEDVEALTTILGVLKPLEPDVQKRLLQSVHMFLGLSLQQKATSHETVPLAIAPAEPSRDFSRDRSLSPKGFLRDKNPSTDVERVACLAYYLTHYRDTPHFKTVDISALNTEAALPRFSNASVAVDNARASGYLVSATKGNKQITALGEKFVELLPDRDAAREAIQSYRPRRTNKKPKAG